MSKYVQDNEWGTKYPNFRKEEFKCPCCGSYGKGIATTLLDTLQDLRTKKGKPIAISSGYRCSKFNKKVGGDSNSAHLIGAAADFYFEDGSLANQNTRVALVNELKKTKYYHWCYCNVNGNHPNMGAAIHFDSNIVDTEPKPTPTPKLNLKYKVGDVMLFTGRLYEKADGTGAGATRNNLKCTITKVYNEPGTTKPYNINNGLGWVAESDLRPYTNSTNSTTELKVGDKVKIIGTGNGSADGDKNTAGGIGWERYVLKIYSGKPYPYQVGSNGVTVGFYKSSALEKK